MGHKPAGIAASANGRISLEYAMRAAASLDIFAPGRPLQRISEARFQRPALTFS
jgi:hypothetical protein